MQVVKNGCPTCGTAIFRALAVFVGLIGVLILALAAAILILGVVLRLVLITHSNNPPDFCCGFPQR